MIDDLLRKGLAWARSFFWVSDSDRSSGSGPAKSGPAKSAATSKPGASTTSTGKSGAGKSGTGKSGTGKSRASGDRRPAADKTSTNKRAATKRSAAKAGAAKTGATKAATKPAGGKSTGPGAPTAAPGAPGDLTEIKGIGPAMKSKLAALGITTFADLAGADAKQLAQKLDSRTLSADRVRTWIAEAKKRS